MHDEAQDELVPVMTVADTSRIPLVLARLDEAGIGHVVTDERAHQMLGPAVPAVILVREADLLRAKEILAELQEGEDVYEPPAITDGVESGSCPSCGRRLEPGEGLEDAPLTTCYHCGADLGTSRRRDAPPRGALPR